MSNINCVAQNEDGFLFFTYNALTRSSTAEAAGVPNTPGAVEKYNLKELIINLLDPIRCIYGTQIIVSSGYRNIYVNKLVGGSPTSNHVFGYAADLQSDGERGANRIYNIALDFKYDECYLESKDVKDKNGRIIDTSWWVHVAYKKEGNKMRSGRIHNGKFIQS